MPKSLSFLAIVTFGVFNISFNSDYSIAANARIIRAVVIPKVNTPKASITDGIKQDLTK